VFVATCSTIKCTTTTENCTTVTEVRKLASALQTVRSTAASGPFSRRRRGAPAVLLLDGPTVHLWILGRANENPPIDPRIAEKSVPLIRNDVHALHGSKSAGRWSQNPDQTAQHARVGAIRFSKVVRHDIAPGPRHPQG